MGPFSPPPHYGTAQNVCVYLPRSDAQENISSLSSCNYNYLSTIKRPVNCGHPRRNHVTCHKETSNVLLVAFGRIAFPRGAQSRHNRSPFVVRIINLRCGRCYNRAKKNLFLSSIQHQSRVVGSRYTKTFVRATMTTSLPNDPRVCPSFSARPTCSLITRCGQNDGLLFTDINH